MKKYIYELIEDPADDNSLSKYVRSFVALLIVLNVLAIIFESIESIGIPYRTFLNAFEIISVVVFTAEYLIRIWICTEDERYQNIVTGRLRFALTFFALIDLLAILPFYLPAIFVLDLRFIRVLRLLRILRILKLGRYSESLQLFGRVFRAKKEELWIMVFVAFILLTVASSFVYIAEQEAKTKGFSSIPEAMWWGVVTLTTVGYGDVYPETFWGKILGAVIALLGVGMIALPAGILGSGFVDELRSKREAEKICPHCGKSIDDHKEP